MASGFIITNTSLDAVTPAGLLQLWQNAFGLGQVVPDTAAFILQPTNLLSSGILGNYTLADLTLDPASYQPVAGNVQVTLEGTTGIVLATWTVNLTISPNTSPMGLALFNQAAGLLFFLSAFAQWPAGIASPYTWIGKVPLGTCQGS